MFHLKYLKFACHGEMAWSPEHWFEGHPPMDTHIMFKLRVKSTYKISEDQERFLLKIWDRKRPK